MTQLMASSDVAVVNSKPMLFRGDTQSPAAIATFFELAISWACACWLIALAMTLFHFQIKSHLIFAINSLSNSALTFYKYHCERVCEESYPRGSVG